MEKALFTIGVLVFGVLYIILICRLIKAASEQCDIPKSEAKIGTFVIEIDSEAIDKAVQAALVEVLEREREEAEPESIYRTESRFG